MMIRNSCQRAIFLTSLVCVCAGAAVLTFFGGRRILAADDKNVEQIKGDERIAVLRFLAAHNEANYRKIETWRGKYHFVDRFPQKIQLASKQKKRPQQVEERDVITIREGTVEFALDMAADKLWSEYQEDGSKTSFLSLGGKEKITPLNHRPVSMKQILTSDRLTQLPNLKYGPVPQHPEDPHHVRRTTSMLARRDAYQPLERTRDTAARLDPRSFYSTGSMPIWEWLSIHIKALKGADGAEVRELISRVLKVAKSGSPEKHEYKVSTRWFSGLPEDEKGSLEVIRFAEGQGYLPVEQTRSCIGGKNIQRHCSWIYQLKNGVLIPKEFHLTVNDAVNARLVLDRHLRYVESVLNEPLPEDTFSTDRFELKKGDRLLDKVENRLYVSDGNKLISATSEVIMKQRRQSRRWMLAWSSGFVFLALSVFLVRRYIRSREHKEGA